MPVTTTAAAVRITPVAIKTFLLHSKRKVKRIKDSRKTDEAHDDLLFDEAFHIVKAFIDFGTKNTVESLQAFTNTHVPAPYWACVCPVTIPFLSCNNAADALIEWFGPEELKLVVGGERWWQVRGLSGVDAEWMAEEEHLDSAPKSDSGKKIGASEANIKRMEKLDTVMLYVHGGAYFWGSINTHRYQILHYAHKFEGRAFAVNYRKAPQYPWPCPLQDVLAAYLYLIRPPPGAHHKAIPPSKIVLAGDSAGGGLCLTVLTILRDLGLPMTAGAVLISPWVDLTHSFPSVMQNITTDIIPKYGFINKHSTLWPVPTMPDAGDRIIDAVTNEPPKPGDADTLKPSLERLGRPEGEVYGPGEPAKTQQEMLEDSGSSNPTKSGTSGDTVSSNSIPTNEEAMKEGIQEDIDQWEPKPPKVLRSNPDSIPLELRSQIQMYAATEHLTHPLVSPILQGSLGNLPPLYIIGGDGEALRDEIVYLAHKAANPSEYPTRKGVLWEARRQKENVEKFTKPTRVHLQIFDGMCHVLTVFTFTRSAKYAYKSIAAFVQHVTQHDADYLELHPFPESEQVAELQKQKRARKAEIHTKEGLESNRHYHSEPVQDTLHQTKLDVQQVTHRPDTHLALENEEIAEDRSQFSADLPYIRSRFLIRERVDVNGNTRAMEPKEQLQALQLKPSEIGVLKEAPALRWEEGQKKWDKRYARSAKRVHKQKAHYAAKAEKLVRHALEQGLIHKPEGRREEVDHSLSRTTTPLRRKSLGEIEQDRRWGPLDLDDERPPATAIAGRRDTPEAVALLKKTIYHTAPKTHLTVPKLKTSDAMAAAFDPNDDPINPPTQSASEQQVKGQLVSLHGLKMWDKLLRYFGKKSATKVVEGISATVEMAGLKSNSM
ncbi:Alpha/Beta hydrolase protein [Gymnopilus junonius]|uniref:Alpha/Beta hydrolase protein n=1 Tax=Gymnopilus junonius TaxID=109634 RepID=A0A9P5P2F0_GYMJU|nr:Alpha/Beta hydrolase protein [Gymnopilus junonius]